MIALKKVLEDAAAKGVTDIRDRLKKKDRVATGRTLKQIYPKIEAGDRSFKLQIVGPAHIQALIDGRKPTKNPSAKGESVWFEGLIEWAQARGIEKSAVYPIFVKINKKGFKGTPDLLPDSVFEGMENMIKKGVNDILKDNYKEEFKRIFK